MVMILCDIMTIIIITTWEYEVLDFFIFQKSSYVGEMEKKSDSLTDWCRKVFCREK